MVTVRQFGPHTDRGMARPALTSSAVIEPALPPGGEAGRGGEPRKERKGWGAAEPRRGEKRADGHWREPVEHRSALGPQPTPRRPLGRERHDRTCPEARRQQVHRVYRDPEPKRP